jgi:plastocyanin
MKKQGMMLFTLCFVVAISMMCVVNANANPTGTASSASVHVKDNAAGTGPDIVQCPPGTKLWVFWTQTNSGSTVGVKIVAPDGSVIFSQSDMTEGQSGSVSFTTTQTGLYNVILYGKYNAAIDSYVVASATVFVTPESLLGALSAATAALAAFGTFSLMKAKYKKR